MIEVISPKAYVHILGQVPSILGLGGRFRQQYRSMASPQLALDDGVGEALVAQQDRGDFQFSPALPAAAADRPLFRRCRT